MELILLRVVRLATNALLRASWRQEALRSLQVSCVHSHGYNMVNGPVKGQMERGVVKRLVAVSRKQLTSGQMWVIIYLKFKVTL